MKQEQIEYIKKMYPRGTMVQLDFMDDPRPVPSGTKGEIIAVDGIGQIHVVWENGSTLALNIECDMFHKI